MVALLDRGDPVQAATGIGKGTWVSTQLNILGHSATVNLPYTQQHGWFRRATTPACSAIRMRAPCRLACCLSSTSSSLSLSLVLSHSRSLSPRSGIFIIAHTRLASLARSWLVAHGLLSLPSTLRLGHSLCCNSSTSTPATFASTCPTRRLHHHC